MCQNNFFLQPLTLGTHPFHTRSQLCSSALHPLLQINLVPHGWVLGHWILWDGRERGKEAFSVACSQSLGVWRWGGKDNQVLTFTVLWCLPAFLLLKEFLSFLETLSKLPGVKRKGWEKQQLPFVMLKRLILWLWKIPKFFSAAKELPCIWNKVRNYVIWNWYNGWGLTTTKCKF